VNASVSYDLSLINFIIPSKKNLEIGLGLVNVLTVCELTAVLAHEFGHFTQRSMAVGRWLYIAQQIAGQIVRAPRPCPHLHVGSRASLPFTEMTLS